MTIVNRKIKVKVVANNPNSIGDHAQDDINKILNREYETVLFNKEDSSVSINEPEFWDGLIVLNENEYVKV